VGTRDRALDRTRRLRAPSAVLTLGAVVPVTFYLLMMLGFPSNYSYTRADFLDKYAHGIFRYRFLTRPLILGLSDVLGKLRIQTVVTPSGRLFTSFLILGAVSIAAMGLVLYRVSVACDESLLGPYMLVIGFLVLAGYVVTPYDYPSYALIAITCVAAFGLRPAHPLICALLAVVATCVRESSFLAAAAAVAVAWSAAPAHHLGSLPGMLRGRTRDAQLWRNTIAVAVACALTYVSIHLLLADPTERGGLTGPGLSYNLHSTSAWVGLALTAVVLVAVSQVYRLLGVSENASRSRSMLWILSAPYVLIFLAGGIWFETPRLMAPILVCELVVISTTGHQQLPVGVPPLRSS